MSAAFALAAAALFGGTAQAQDKSQDKGLEHPATGYSQHTQALVKEFNAAKATAPIVMLDRDIFMLNLALRHIDPFDPPARAALIAELAKEQTGLTIPAQNFVMATYQMTGEDPSTWSPGYGPSVGAAEPGFCTVTGQDPDSDGPSQLRSLMNLGGPFEPLGARLLNPLSRADINAYTDYHEIGHCFYYVPPPAPDADRDAVIFQRHKNETFGDVFASLLMARDGTMDFAGRYARVRLVASAVAGVDDEYLHATWDGLEAAQREIDARGVDAMKKMSVTEIRDLARRITEENAIDVPTMRAAAAFQHKDYDEAALKDATAEQAAYARHMKDRMNDAMAKTADLRGLGPGNPSPLELVKYYSTRDEETPEASGPTYQQITARVRDELLAEAGKNPSPKSLAQAMVVRKEALRKTLDNGDDVARGKAMHDLSLMERAFKQALDTITPKAPKPGA